MWNLKDRNKVVGTQDKVNAFKKHLQAMYQIKPSIKIQQPWRPSFSLSKFNNKYHKFGTMELLRQNSTLIGHLTDISNDEKFNTFLEIPPTVPSNKETFKCFKRRQRNREQATVDRENSVFLPIMTENIVQDQVNQLEIQQSHTVQRVDKERPVQSEHRQEMYDIDQKKEFNPDFYLLAKQSFMAENHDSRISYRSNSQSKVNLRPKTALPR